MSAPRLEDFTPETLHSLVIGHWIYPDRNPTYIPNVEVGFNKMVDLFQNSNIGQVNKVMTAANLPEPSFKTIWNKFAGDKSKLII